MKIDYDIKFMELAVKLAKYSLDHGETPVACIYVHIPSNKIIAYGMNDTNKSRLGISHAEFMGIDQIYKNNFQHLLNEIALYVTVEPCIMCASAIKQLGIKKVVFGCGNERFGGNGSILSIHNDFCTLPTNNHSSLPGILRKEAIVLLRQFYVRENERAPVPRSKNNRKLELEEFPPFLWSKYLSKEDFVDTFGSENLTKYETDRDLFSSVNWKLVEGNYDNIVNELELQINSFEQHKKRKFSL
ncbi:probable tRNA-specific adenosine deaminase subunit TAD2 [Saccharomycodes ludwigii]|uniref:tRNA(adenine(34)) deaminase n=1 Tax=Saccharomycodes ludwigii TaxID=36035 RepID=A0A376B846_9ASCO|nr:hypothetical protein SCDLUD_004662 [Saccharomycodes ludwigii]KAH3899229.1 hypothetical protein SCDLUD_004662 [Saccharomycodes ludwigii]SSD60848.1 probable tRNA-specific adenosine deaminase subunit TAD2 [Saccharomycodes ludwigii]